MVMQKLLVATRSLGKKQEIRSILGHLPYEIVFPEDVGLHHKSEEDVLETEPTFEGNARKKAEYFCKRSGLPTVADDSGIEVTSLGGQPGVRSRRSIPAESRRFHMPSQETSSLSPFWRRCFCCWCSLS